MERDKQMNRNRKLFIPKQEKPKIRNRHERKLQRERKVAYAMALIVLAILIVGVVGNTILVGGIFK